MGYETFIAKRYLLSPRSDRSISVITCISISGVALGVIALIVSTSVMNGFRTNLRNAVTGSLPHITVFSWDDSMTDFFELQKSLSTHPKVKGVAPYIFKQTMLTGSFNSSMNSELKIPPPKSFKKRNKSQFFRYVNGSPVFFYS